MSKKDKITNKKIEEDFPDLMKDLKDYYSTRKAENGNLQKIGIKLNKKIENYKPSLLENLKSIYNSSKNFYHLLMSFWVFITIGVIGIIYYYRNYNPIVNEDTTILKTENIPNIALTKSSETEIGVNTDSIFTFASEKPINQQTLEENIKIEPEIDYSVNWKNDTEVEIIPNEELEINTEYKVILGIGTQFGEEEPIQDDLIWNFKTRPTFALTGITPIDGSTTAPLDTSIEFEFNYNNINLESFNSHLVIEPEISGHTEIHQKKVVFLPDERLNPNITYKVSVSEGVENEYGEKIAEGINAEFSVSNNTTDGDFISYPRFNLYPEQKVYSFAETPTITIQHHDLTSDINIIAYKLTKEDLISFLNTETLPEDSELEIYANYSFLPTEDYYQTYNFEGLEKGLYLMSFENSESQITEYAVINYSNYGIYNAEGTNNAYVWGFDLSQGNTVKEGSLDIYKKNENKTYEFIETKNFDSQGETILEEQYDLIIGEIKGESVVLLKNHSYYYYESYGNVSIGSEDYRTYIYTDRPIYEPGDTVNFKGIVRKENDLQYSIPEGETVTITVPGDTNSSTWQGYEIPNLFEKDYQLNSYGTFSGEFTLPNNELYGVYLYAYIDDQFIGNSNYINVTTYSKAQFEIDATLDKTEYIDGEKATLTVNVNRYSGEPYQGKANICIDTNSIYQTSNYWPDENYLEYYKEGRMSGYCDSESIEFELDEDGQVVYEFTVDYENPEITVGQLVAEIEIVGEDEINSTTKTGALVYTDDIDIFAQTEITTAITNNNIKIELGSFISGTNKKTGGIPFQAYIERTWYEEEQIGTKYYENLKKSVPVYSSYQRTEIMESFEAITDENGNYSYDFTPTESGSYNIYITILGEKPVQKKLTSLFYAINKTNTNTPKMVFKSDKTTAESGENIKLTITSSYDEDKEVVLFSYRGNVYSTETIIVKANSTVEIEKTIEKDYSPRMYYKIIYTSEKENYYTNNAELRTVITSENTTIKVEDESSKLNIQVINDKEVYNPGENATFEFLVTDSNGNGVETELSISAVDKALLDTLRTYTTDIYTKFYETVSQTIKTYNTNSEFFGAGGYGDAGPDRKNFEDTAIWESNIVTDKNGKATLTTTLPDNLTTWVLDIKGVTQDTKVGQTTSEFKVSKDLYVEYNLPEYLRYEDEINLPVRITNNSGTAISGNLDIEVEGAEIIDNNSFEIEIENGKTIFKTFKIKVKETESLKVKVSLKQEKTILDAVTKETEVLALSQINQEVSGFIFDENTNEYVLNIDNDVNLELSSYILNLSTSVLGQSIYTSSTIQANSSIELASTIIKNATIINHYDEIQPDTEKEKLISIVEEAIERIMPNQRYNGGFGWFSYDSDNVETSSYVMLALTIAKDSGFEVTESTISYLENYLLNKLQSEETTYQDKAFILYALSKTELEEILPATTYLISQKDQFDNSPSTLAYLALALFNQGNTGDGISLIADLESLSNETERWAFWEEPESDYNIIKGKTTITALSYDVLESYNREIANKTRNYLVENTYSFSGQSVDATTATYALIRHNSNNLLSQSGEVSIYVNNSETPIKVLLNKYGSTEIKIDNTLLQTGENKLRIDWAESEINQIFGKVFSTENSNNLNSRNNGITVETQFYDLKSGEEKYNFVSGDAVIMETTINSEIDGNYVQVNSLVPAGFEILSYTISSTSSNVLNEFYKNDPFLIQWGDRKTTDQYVFNLYEIKTGEEYKFQIPLIATSAGKYQTSGSSANFINAPDINGQSEVKTIIIE